MSVPDLVLEDHMLNRFGRTTDGRGGGILLWKRSLALVKRSSIVALT